MEFSLVAIVVLTGFLHASWNAIVKGGPDNWVSAGIVMGTAAIIGAVTVSFFPWPRTVAWPWIIYSGIVHTAYLGILVATYRIGDLGRVYPIARGSAPALVVIASVPLLAETLSLSIYIGVFVIIAAILSFALEPSKGAKFHRRSLLFALLTGGFIASYSMIDAVGIRVAQASGHDTVMYIMWLFVFGSGPFAAYILWTRRSKLHLYRGRHGLISVGGGLIALVGYGLVLWSYGQGATAPIAALRESGVIFAALIGSLAFGEGHWRRRAAASCLFVAGAVAIQL